MIFKIIPRHASNTGSRYVQCTDRMSLAATFPTNLFDIEEVEFETLYEAAKKFIDDGYFDVYIVIYKNTHSVFRSLREAKECAEPLGSAAQIYKAKELY